MMSRPSVSPNRARPKENLVTRRSSASPEKKSRVTHKSFTTVSRITLPANEYFCFCFWTAAIALYLFVIVQYPKKQREQQMANYNASC